MVVLAGGLALYRLWIGIAALGLELILMGMALGMAKPAAPAEPDERL
jgi:hypothetical protein